MKRKLFLLYSLCILFVCAGCGTTGSGENTAEKRSVSGGVELSPIDSRYFNAAHYDSRSKSLTLQFNHGATYRYADVPRGVYKSFLKAKDKGDFYRREIRTQYTGTYLLD